MLALNIKYFAFGRSLRSDSKRLGGVHAVRVTACHLHDQRRTMTQSGRCMYGTLLEEQQRLSYGACVQTPAVAPGVIRSVVDGWRRTRGRCVIIKGAVGDIAHGGGGRAPRVGGAAPRR